MSLYVRIKILGTYSYGGDQEGNTIEQIVAVEMPNGIRLGIFDWVEMKVTPDMVGKEMEIAIMVISSHKGVNIITEVKPEIIPSSEKVNDYPYHYRGHRYFGQVKEVGVKDVWHKPFAYDKLIRIDVGVCDVLTNPDADTFKNLKVGDYVELNGLTDLLDIRPVKS